MAWFIGYTHHIGTWLLALSQSSLVQDRLNLFDGRSFNKAIVPLWVLPDTMFQHPLDVAPACVSLNCVMAEFSTRR
jgi:hypothetical protein